MTALELIKTKLAKFESVIVVMKDDEAKKVIGAWISYGQKCSDFVVSPTADPRVTAERLWEEAEPIDLDQLSLISGVPATRAGRIFERLRICSLIFPDGTISDGASRLIYGEAFSTINSWRRGTYGRTGEGGASIPKPSADGVREGAVAESGAGPVRRGKAGKARRGSADRSK